MKKWHSVLFTVASLVLGAYLILAVTAFNHPDTADQRCEEVEINIEEGTTDGFLTEDEVGRILQQHHLNTKYVSPDSIQTRKIEDVLNASPLVKKAECSITNGGKLIINITQRLPIVHVMTQNSDYYLDDTGQIMPPTGYTSNLIIATGYITRAYAQRSLFPLVNTINHDELWHQMIEQINILPDKGVELTPRVGNHIVCLGAIPTPQDDDSTAETVETFAKNQLKRLEKFYRYGLAKAGWNKYRYINLEYDNQIICKKY